MRILIGADLVPTKSNEYYFIHGRVNEIVEDKLLDIIKQADYRIFNLEVPLVDTVDPIPKRGPNLIAKSKTITGIKELGVNLLSISNNHILDQGKQGLFNTIRVIENAGINHVGAGPDLRSARKPFVFEADKYKVGIYSCCEHEFSVAEIDEPGANPFDPYNTIDDIINLKSKTDFVFVLYHGGREEYRYPSPELQRRCRRMIEKGADLIVCQHTHCIGCEENYLNGKIIYGQGNFLFDMNDNEYWNCSLLLNCDIDKSKTVHYSYIPIVKNKAAIRLAEETESQTILSGFLKRSDEITNSDFITRKYSEYASTKINDYLSSGFGVFRTCLFGKIINRVFGRRIWSLFFREKDYLSLINILECEAHHELFRHAIKDKIHDDLSRST